MLFFTYCILYTRHKNILNDRVVRKLECNLTSDPLVALKQKAQLHASKLYSLTLYCTLFTILFLCFIVFQFKSHVVIDSLLLDFSGRALTYCGILVLFTTFLMN